MGSQFHARQSRLRGDRIAGMLCLEMVRYFSDAEKSQSLPDAIPKSLRRFFPWLGNFLAAIGNLAFWLLCQDFPRGFKKRGANEMPLFSLCLPESVSDIRLSENSSFWDQGYPALMMTDTSYLRNPHYPKASDRPETPDYPRMTQVKLGDAATLKCVGG